MTRQTIKLLLPLLCILALPALILAQDDVCKDKALDREKGEFILWYKCRTDQVVAARTSQAVAAKISQRNLINQSETPRAVSSSSTLVDTSSAAELLGVGINLAGLASNSSEKEASSMSVTVSAYALKAAAVRRDSLDPGFYAANRDWRKLSFTLGYEYPEGMEGDPNARATIFGIKYLPLNKRDASHPDNGKYLLKVSNAVQEAAKANNRIARRVQGYLLNLMQSAGAIGVDKTVADFINQLGNKQTWQATIYTLIGPKELSDIDQIISEDATAATVLKEIAIEAAEKIRRADQISFQYLTKQRRGNLPDEHEFEGIVDLGLSGRGNFTLNAAFQYVDNKLSEDTKGGSFAAAFQYQLTRDQLEGSMPWMLTISSEGKWMTKTTPAYKAQAKLTIPILDGIDLPISFTVANRTELIKETDVRGKIGFTFDVARIADRFKASLFGRK